ncbi:MAG TPA: nitroreductase family protein [Bacteroidia bacterium]|nr:nitroreductase family protein [Bacteroidia bacterium]
MDTIIPPIHSLISERRSIRAFDPRPMDDPAVYSLFEAARWAPSAFNEQPWRFIVARREQEEEFLKMLEILAPSNRNWAINGSLLILTIAKMFTSHDHRPNRHALHDVGLAVGNLSLQATAMGLSLHQMGGFDSSKARAFYNIPDGYEPISVILVGYPGNAELLPETLRQRESSPRVRMPVEDIVFSTKFGSGQSIVQHSI